MGRGEVTKYAARVISSLIGVYEGLNKVRKSEKSVTIKCSTVRIDCNCSSVHMECQRHHLLIVLLF